MKIYKELVELALMPLSDKQNKDSRLLKLKISSSGVKEILFQENSKTMDRLDIRLACETRVTEC